MQEIHRQTRCEKNPNTCGATAGRVPPKAGIALSGINNRVAQLADEIGYRYAYDPETKQYAHPSGVIVLTPEGKISRYIFGATFELASCATH